MTTLNTIIEEEKIEEKIDTICKQADQYQINAGYPVSTPAKTIILSLFTTAMQRAYEAGKADSAHENTPDTEKLYQEKELAYQMKATGNRSQTDHTPDTEWEAKMLVETLHSILADISSFEPDGEVYTLVEQAHTELAKLRTLLTSRDTYWKEMVIEKYGSYTCPCGCKETLEEAITNEDNLK